MPGERVRYQPRVRITLAEYTELLEKQGGGCAICESRPKTRRLHVDHNHKTGEVRGLLCMRCNRNLPAWVTPEWLRSALAYLEP